MGILTNDEEDANVGVLDDHGADGVDVLLVLGNTAVGDGELAVGGGGGAVAVGEVVDDELTGVVATSLVGTADVGQSAVD